MRQAGCFFAYERLGLTAGEAEIFRSPSPWNRVTWEGEARSKPSLDFAEPREWDAATLRNVAAALFAGPIAGELWAGRDALNSIGGLHAASTVAFRAAELDRRVASEQLGKRVAEAIALVESDEQLIQIIAEVLERSRCIDRNRPWMIPKVLQHVGRGAIKAASLSLQGRALSDKIRGALAQLEFLGLPTFEETAR